MQRIVELLSERIDYYNWVGFYLVDNKDKGLLTLGPFVGEPTEHEKIKFGQGICGQAQVQKLLLLEMLQKKKTIFLVALKQNLR